MQEEVVPPGGGKCAPIQVVLSREQLHSCMQVLDRIMRVDYRIPKYPRISPECRDLVTRILVGDPDERLTIAQIQRHPWCAQYSGILKQNVLNV